MTGAAQSIWIISKYASSREYGFETRLFAMAREMVKLGRRITIIASDSNHLATYPAFPETYNRETIAGVLVRWIRTLKYQRTASVRRVLSWFDFEWKLLRMPKQDLPRPDVIVVSSLSLLTILSGVLLRRKYGCKLIFEIRDIWPLTATEEGGFGHRHPLVLFLGWVERFGYKHSDLVIGTMPNLQEHVANIAGPDVPVACVPFGFDPSTFPAEAPAPQPVPGLDIPPGRLVVGYAGSIGVTNALDTIMAVVRALKDDPRFYFVFLGDGDCRERYVAETKDLGNVVFLGKVERKKVAGVLAHCDLLYFAVHDSLVWRYGLSLNKLIDYMMAGKPVVASYGGYQSMLNEAHCGEFVPAADVEALRAALVRFAEMPAAERTAMGQAGRRWLVANRSWDVLARQYLALCDDLVTPASGRPGAARSRAA